MAHAFISYSRKDQSFIQEFEQEHAMRRQSGALDFDLWIDQHDIGAGHGWTEAIDTNIREAFALVLVMSNNSLKSGYVQYEWAFARGCNKPVIPLKLDPVADDDLLMMLRQQQSLSFTDGHREWQKLYTRLLELSPDATDATLTIEKARQLLTDARESYRRDALKTLNLYGKNARALKVLGDALHSTLPDVRLGAAEILLLSPVEMARNYLLLPSSIGVIVELLSDRKSAKLYAPARELLLSTGTDDALIAALLYEIEKRRHIIEQLAGRGKSIVPKLNSALETQESPRLRTGILEALGEIADDETIPVVVKHLRDKDEEVKTAAARTLLKFDKPTAYAEALTSGNKSVMVEAGKQLIAGGKGSISAIAAVIEKGEPATLEIAGAVLKRIGPPAVGKLMSWLESSPRADIRRYAAMTLGELAVQPTLGVLCNALQDPDAGVRLAVVQAIGKFTRIDDLSVLIPMLSDKDIHVRLEGIRLLGQRGGSMAARWVSAALKDDSMSVRLLAVETLHKLKDKEAIPSLIKVINDPSSHVADSAAKALLMFGTPAALTAVLANSSAHADAAEKALLALKSFDALRPVMKHGSVTGRLAAIAHLKDLGVAAAPIVLSGLKDRDVNIRQQAALALGDMGAVNTVGSLLELRTDPAVVVREAVAQALGKLRIPLAIDVLVLLLDDKSPQVRYAATKALGQIGKVAAPRMLELVQYTGDKWWLRKCAALALGEMKETRALPRLRDLLARDDVAEVREAAAIGLGRMCDASAIKPLEAVLANKQEQQFVCKSARWALQRIATPEALEAIQRHHFI